MDEMYETEFAKFPYELSTFQKQAIVGIIQGQDVLVCAGTGSGKTVPIEFGLQYHVVEKQKRCVYLGPLKALNNQKYYDFSKKFPEISFGIATGDIKYNLTAQVIVATTEIFMNFLLTATSSLEIPLASEASIHEDGFDKTVRPDPEGGSIAPMGQNGSFLLQINELSFVIFDEVHYILDEARGAVWEKTLMLLPPHVQILMCSATLENPLKLAQFVESRHCSINTKKVRIVELLERVVPLTHYGFLTTTESIFKKIKDKEIHEKIRTCTNKLICLKHKEHDFLDHGYHQIKSMSTLFDKNQMIVKRSHVVNTLSRFLVEKEMLPAIAFCFSRKTVEQCAFELTTNLLEFDSKIPYTIRHEAESMLRSKFTNYQEYIHLPEYESCIALLEKRIGIHHGGMIPVLRELVELFIDKKYIQMLFATDSFSVGLNCPIKTTIFLQLSKYNGQSECFLPPHLYTQCAGRAGRRGIDTIGNVIHCNNLFTLPCLNEYRNILCGKPQKMQSQFRISFDLILSNVEHTFCRTISFLDEPIHGNQNERIIEFVGKVYFKQN